MLEDGVQMTVNHHCSVLYKNGEQFVHECDGTDCRMVEEARTAGFLERLDVEAVTEWRPRTDDD